ncbi:LLM class flavin-dependent oxidoreductase [Streptomyces sp. NPDC047081]|uniref:LLM class flavin-dependent oxidoreductase n=1 Tax=Streptomyces sp. NPDC047081 TaxID=3154706 RepID=UPI0033DD13D2
MKVGIYFDLRNPPPWRQSWPRLYGFALEMCEEADRLGLDSVWFSEHHGFEDGYLPQPLTMAAAAAARTRRVRLGTAVVPAPLHAAPELAEQAAIVDIISDGRLDLGLGTGYRVPEYRLFGADLTKRYSTTDQRVREIRGLWAEALVTPGPVQDPLPIWLGYQGPQGARRAGRLGTGLLSLNPALLTPYREGLAESGYDASIARMQGSFTTFVTEDPDGDWPVVRRHLAYQWDSYRRYLVEGTDQPVPRPIDPEKWRATGLSATGVGQFLYGTPQETAEAIRAYVAGLPVEGVFLWASLAGMPEEMVARQVQLIAGKLRPLLADV